MGTEPRIAVVYHDDNDGFCAALAFWKVFGNDAVYLPTQYGRPFPAVPTSVCDVYIVDFSYERATCEKFASFFDKLVILDHHEKAEKDLEGLPYAIFDKEHSGCVMAWKYLEEMGWGIPAKQSMPALFSYVEDRDLWKFELDDSDAINLFLHSVPRDFIVWLPFLNDAEFLKEALEYGPHIKAFRDQQISGAVKYTNRITFAGYDNVPFLNLTANISETLSEILKADPTVPFVVSYFDIIREHETKRVYSVRSLEGSPVTALEIASKFGGGGHKHASGFHEMLNNHYPKDK